MLRRMPARDALVVYIDFSELRRAGILQLLDGSKVGEEPEYQSFVRQTYFDYKQDLDAVLVAFSPDGKYLLLRGKFDWKSLIAYAKVQDGTCNNSLCRMRGSTPDRHISFFPLQSNLMALGVSRDDTAALRMNQAAPGPDPEVPEAPVWLSIPPSLLKSGQKLPDGAQMFARGLERAEAATLALTMEGGGYAAKLNVRCGNDQDAAVLRSELDKATAALRRMFELDHQKPSPLDLSGFLTSGSFRNEGRRVFGYWPIERAFVQNMLGG